MKASVEWLKEYADINVSAMELCDILTLTGSKVETLESRGGDIKNVVVGKILEIEKHPDADKLVITKVDAGKKLQIVTGANNIKVGDIVPIAKVNSELPGGIKIKAGKLRGVDSFGMMCSVGELGLDINNYPDQIEHGIMILPKEYEERIGEEITDVLNLKEDIIDFEITPNRPDCLSIEGLGRETAVSLNVPFKNPHKNIDEMKVKDKDEIEGLRVKIEAPDLCYRYIARVVKDVKIEESPEWLKRRLIACDVRPINNIVDITNYVMLEFGQPMHAFDINSIEGKNITVRRARENEEIITLDEEKRCLDKNMLVIADDKKAVAIAGVMGGQNSEIEKDTKTVVFESALFNGPNVRNTAKKLGLRTEASSRFEKGLHPENTERAINRAIELVEMLNAGKIVDGKIDIYPTKIKENKVELDVERINKLLGVEVSKENMEDILIKLGMKIENNIVTPPYFRQDIENVADLAEEIIRFYGYDKLGSTLPDMAVTVGEKNKIQSMEYELKHMLKNLGFSEICTYGFINSIDLEKSNIKYKNIEEDIVKIKNPLNGDYTIMRPSTVPSMMKTLAINNSKKNKEVKLFDISRTYLNKENAINNGEVPEENKILTIGIYGEDVDFYYLKGIVENVLEIAGVPKYDIIKQKENESYHPGRCANLKVGNDIFVTFGEIHPVVSKNYEIQNRVLIAEIDLNKVQKYSRKNKKYVEIPKYPAVERDIAVVVNEEIEAKQIEDIIIKKSKKVLEQLKLFDVYRDEKIGQDRKSLAYALKFRTKDRTLTDKEINPIMEDIIKELEEKLGAELRK